MEIYDIIIIGGGASGLATAIMSKQEGNRILIIEHNDRVGKKILSTGNGKCNLTNIYCRVGRQVATNFQDKGSGLYFAENPEKIEPYYSSGNTDFAKIVIGNFDVEHTLGFFWDLGMIPLERNGCVYPRSEQASAVLDMLRFRAEELGVEYLLGYQPMKIEKTKEGFCIDRAYACKNLVIATGGQNAPKTGSDGSGYEIAKSFGHRIIQPLPALCALKCKEPFFKELKGVRTDAELSVQSKSGSRSGEEPVRVSGNLQFNDSGISGIPVFQLSLSLARSLARGEEVCVKINLLPEIPGNELMEALYGKTKNRLLGILPKKLANVIEKECAKQISNKNTNEACAKESLKKAYRMEHVSDEEFVELCRLVHTIQEFKVHPVKTASFEEAQTTLGGVSTEEINPFTMESKLVKGLYFTGEIVDVSGICGGYNLQWAWATANAASKGLRKENSN